MGVDQTAMMVIGVDVTGKLAKRITKEVPSCVHQQPPTTKILAGINCPTFSCG